MKYFPILKTDRLVLKRLRRKDVEIMTIYANDEDLSKHTLNIPFPYKEKDAMWFINISSEYFENLSKFIFGIYSKGDDSFIGCIEIGNNIRDKKGGVGYWVAKKYWNKGFMTEALKRVISFGFEELNLNKIEAQFIIENTASEKVMQKVGMLKEATLIDHNFAKGRFRTVVQYRLLRKEFNIK